MSQDHTRLPPTRGEGQGLTVADEPPMPSARIVSYICTDDAPARYEAVAYIWLDGERLPVVFAAATPEEARARAQAHWDAILVKHGDSMIRRAEGRRKAAETRALKASQTSLRVMGKLDESAANAGDRTQPHPPGGNSHEG